MGLHDRRSTTVTADVIEVAGHDVLTASPEQLRRMRGASVSLVFQDALSALNPVLTIGDQIGELYRQHQGASRKQARSRGGGDARAGRHPRRRRAGSTPTRTSSPAACGSAC